MGKGSGAGSHGGGGKSPVNDKIEPRTLNLYKTETFTTKEEVAEVAAVAVVVAVVMAAVAVEDMVRNSRTNLKEHPSVITMSSNGLLEYLTNK